MRNPILVALDVPDRHQALRLVDQLRPVVGGFKVGKELFVREGPSLVREIRASGASVFLDLKFHDIPNTVARAVASAVELDVQMLTVHASGGREMLQAAVQATKDSAAQTGKEPPLVLAVTVLTSLNQAALAEIGVETPLSKHVERLAQLAFHAGVRGLVCSPLEVPFLRQLLPEPCTLVTPGIRPTAAPADDQHRTLSASEALAAGADWLVIGRPICAAPDPRRAAEEIQAQCHAASNPQEQPSPPGDGSA